MYSPLDSTQGTSIDGTSLFSFSSIDDCPSATLPKRHAKNSLAEPSSYDKILSQFKPLSSLGVFDSESPNLSRRVQKINSATPVLMNYEEAYAKAEKYLDSLNLNILTARDCQETKLTPTLKPCMRMEKACSFKIKPNSLVTKALAEPKEEAQEAEVHSAMPSFLANRNKLVRAKTEKFKLSSLNIMRPTTEEIKEDSCSPKTAVLPASHGH